MRESPEDPTDGNDTDNDVFRSGSESPQFTLPVIADPKQRRATVSGGSPTFERSSLVADDLDPGDRARGHGGLSLGHSLDPPPVTTAQRPKSQAINAQEKEAAIAALLAAGDGTVGGAFSLLKKSPAKKENESNLNETSSTTVTKTTTTTDDDNSNKDTASDTPSIGAQRDCAALEKEVTAALPSQSEGTEADGTTGQGSGSAPQPQEDLSGQEKKVVAGAESAELSQQEMPVKVNSTADVDTEVARAYTEAGALAQPVSSEDAEPLEKEDKIHDFTIHKPTPVLRQNAIGGNDYPSGKSWSRSKIISTEVAGNAMRSDVPRLKRIKRLDSQEAADLEPKMEDDDVFDKPQKKVGFSEDVGNKDMTESFTHIVVGGVVQKIPSEKSKGAPIAEATAVKMRPKTGSKTKLDRRVSCKDLGRGDCEGWLHKRKQKDRMLSKHWDKRWCVLKHQDLYYYKQRDALKAEGRIHLPAFQVSPATNLKNKKFAFKIHNTGTTFYFASERQEDMSKWMNKLGLAAINFDTKSNEVAIGGFNRPEKLASSSSAGARTVDYSESEDEADDTRPDTEKWQGSAMSLVSTSSLGSSSGSLAASNSSPLMRRHHLKEVQESVGASTEELQAMLRSIQTQDLTIDGKDKVRQRRSQCTAASDLGQLANQAEVERLRKLNSLQRTLRAKELQLQVMDNLMKNPAAIRELQDFVDLSGSLNTSSDSASSKM